MRLVAVLGFSDRRTVGLHPVCAARIALAGDEARPDDAVLFSGWARGRAADTEADLMARIWSRPVRTVLVDRGARTTLGNAIGIAEAARRVAADEVLLVTSRWHGRRAAKLLRAALRGSGTRVMVATTDEPVALRTSVREIASWAAVPILALVAARMR